jgi:hypothetical protein
MEKPLTSPVPSENNRGRQTPHGNGTGARLTRTAIGLSLVVLVGAWLLPLSADTAAFDQGANRPPVASGTSSPATAVRFDAPGDSLFRASNLPPIGSFTVMGWFRILGDTTA